MRYMVVSCWNAKNIDTLRSELQDHGMNILKDDIVIIRANPKGRVRIWGNYKGPGMGRFLKTLQEYRGRDK